MDVIYEDEFIKLSLFGNSENKNSFLSFTGVGHKLGAIQKEEFIGTINKLDSFGIFITDKKRHWYNYPRFAKILIEKLSPFLKGKKLYSLGNSMGGFGAIWITRYLNIEKSISFVPQFSVNKEIIPKDLCFWKYTKDIEVWNVKSLEGYFNDETKYYTFNSIAEKVHWNNFPIKENIAHYIIDSEIHQISKLFKDKGILHTLIENCISGETDINNIISSASINSRLLI